MNIEQLEQSLDELSERLWREGDEKNALNIEKILCLYQQLLTQKPDTEGVGDEMDAMAMYMIIATEKDHEKGREKFLSWLKQLLTRQKPQEVDEELLKYWEGMMLFLSNHGWIDPDKRAMRIKQLLTRQPQKRVVTRGEIEEELNAHLRLEDEALRDYVHVVADIIVEIFTHFGLEVTTEK